VSDPFDEDIPDDFGMDTPPDLIDTWIETAARRTAAHGEVIDLVVHAELRWIRYVQAMFTPGRRSDPADLDIALDALATAVPVLRDDDEVAREALAEVLLRYADMLQARHDFHGDASGWRDPALAQTLRDRRGSTPDLDLAIEVTVEAAALLAPGSPVWYDAMKVLGDRYVNRTHLTQDPQDFKNAITALEAALAVPGRDPSDRVTPWMRWGLLYHNRFEALGDSTDRDRTIEILGAGWAEGTNDPLLGLSYADPLISRGRATGNDEDLRTALAVLGTVNEAELPDPARPLYHQTAMSAHFHRYFATTGHDPDELLATVRESTAVITNAYAAADIRDEARAVRATARLEHARVTGNVMPDVDAVIDDLTAVHHRVKPALRDSVDAQLAVALGERARRTSAPIDVDRAIDFAEEVLTRVPDGHPSQPYLGEVIATGLLQQVAAGRGDPDALDRAVGMLRRLRDQPGTDPVLTAKIAARLGVLMGATVFHHGADIADLDQAIDHLATAFTTADLDDPNRSGFAAGLANTLMTRYELRGDLADLRWSLDVLRDVRHERTDDPNHGEFAVILGQALISWYAVSHTGTPDEAIDVLTEAVTGLPSGHPMLPSALRSLAAAYAFRAEATQDPAMWRTAADYANQAVAGTRPRTIDAAMINATAGDVLLLAGRALSDVILLRTAVTLLTAVADDPAGHALRSRHLSSYGMALVSLHQMDPTAADLTHAIDVLSEANRIASTHPGARDTPEIASVLAAALTLAGDLDRAAEVGRTALRAQAWQVLLQSGTHDAMDAVREGSRTAVMIARASLRAGRPHDAFAALETGRGLVLHAATVTATVPELLTTAGHADLATEWTTTATADRDVTATQWRTSSPQIPSDLRHRTLTALTGHPQLFDPPSHADLCGALRTLAADALIYIFAGAWGSDGLAVVVDADGINAIDLPLLTSDWPVPAAVQQAAAARDLQRPQKTPADRTDLTQVCEAAWDAVIEPLLRTWRPADRPDTPHLILVPAGVLATVPWHAAHSAAGPDGSRRWAIDEASFTYIASARLLIDIAGRTAPPPGPVGMIIGDPDTGGRAPDLHGAGIEAGTIFQRFYTGGSYRGRPVDLADGPGTPDDILAWLTGTDTPHASVLHLACHGDVRADGPASSSLILADGVTLSAEEILRAAATRAPGSSPGLISLAACTTHRAGRTYDEAVTLSTAFLAAGAATAVGSLWQVPDDETALLMVEFHTNLQAHAMPPHQALRAAQRTMRDTSSGTSRYSWAGFVHLGA
jgi:CHAT domain-containing protein